MLLIMNVVIRVLNEKKKTATHSNNTIKIDNNYF